MVCHFCFAHIKVIATNFSIFPGLYVWCKWIRSPTMWHPTCPVENPTCFNSNIFSSNRCLTDRPMFVKPNWWCVMLQYQFLLTRLPMAHVCPWLNPHVSCLNPLVFPSCTGPAAWRLETRDGHGCGAAGLRLHALHPRSPRDGDAETEIWVGAEKSRLKIIQTPCVVDRSIFFAMICAFMYLCIDVRVEGVSSNI